MALNMGDNVVYEEDAATYRLFGGEPEFYGMTLAGIDLAVPGNHDFALGADFFADALEHADFGLLCTNFLEERSDRLAERFLPYKVVDFDGLRVGYFGLLIAAYDSRDYVSDNYMTIAREVVRLLREEERCTVVIALSHLGYLWDRELAGAVDGIDVICGGHTHLALKRPAVVNGTAIVHGGAYGQEVGELSLFVDDAGEVVSLDWELRAIDGTVPDDEEVLAFLEPFWDAYPGKDDRPASAGGGGCSMTFAPALFVVPLLLLQVRSGLGRR
jgi:2',3'-cyclic-nucleotide 2'-phosphodiesterase (5'-nucleotidase family)